MIASFLATDGVGIVCLSYDCWQLTAKASLEKVEEFN